MLYEAKKRTKAYEYIKGILDAEEKEYQAYMKRVEEAVGFKFEKYQGYQPNRALTREYEITAIWFLSELYDTLDKKVWKKIDGVKLEDGYYVAIAPNKRYKQGKAWDAEKKMIVDLKKKVELKPFDKVVVRCSEADRWSIDFFSYKAPNGYICTGDAWFGYCLPYNEETAKLIGTTKDMEV